MTSLPLIAAVVPAFNEGDRIHIVLAVLRQAACLSEIIVVDDGSSDNTLAVAQQAAARDPRVRCVHLAHNQGKASAMLAGARTARAGCLLFLDADLTGLTPEQVEALVWPVLHNRADMSIGLFRHGRWNTDLAHRLTPFLSGQRCLRTADFLQVAERPSGRGYGIETALTVAARRYRWRCQRVALEGVSHPSSELHRGWLPGLARRAYMYSQIVGTWHMERGWLLLAPRLPLTARLALLALAIALSSGLAYNRSQASVPGRVSDLPELPLEGVHRLLVLAPHPDDETLGAAGVIQSALAQGSDVRVVILTNGDGQRPAPLALRGQLRLGALDYIRDGEVRQLEALTALESLGMPESSVIFMGYPDGAIEKLWLSSWSTGCPVQANFTRATVSPYAATFNTGARYCGDDLLGDLESIITHFLPDMVLLPHPHDEHADHRAATAFARMALARVGLADSLYHPSVWGYLVHYGDFPRPRGQRLTTELSPPLPLLRDGQDWVRQDLSATQVRTKATALRAYATQQRLLGAFLYSFARQNELFVRLETFDGPRFALDEAPLLGALSWHSVEEPARESARRLLMRGSDLVELRVARVGDQLWVSAITAGPLIDRLQYELMIKTPEGRTETMRFPGQAERTGLNDITGEWSLEGLGSPDMVAVSARVRQGGTLDLTAWRLIGLTELGVMDAEP